MPRVWACQVRKEWQDANITVGKNSAPALPTVAPRLTGLAAVSRFAGGRGCACSSMHARLPTVAELEFLAALSDYNGGVSLRSDVWVLPGGMVYAPDLPNPSPVRSADEVSGPDLHFYCVR